MIAGIAEDVIQSNYMKFTCKECGITFERYVRKSHQAKGRGKYCSRICFHKAHSRYMDGIQLKEKITYGSLHDWLHKKFGSANKCDMSNCERRSSTFQYALIRGKKYERNRDNFMMLCRPCHYKYDNANLPLWRHLSSLEKKI